jgi:Predicted aminopeptidases
MNNRYIYYIVSFLFLLPVLSFGQLNQDLVQYKESINQDSLKRNIEELQAFGSRYAFNPNHHSIALYLKNRLQEYGWETRIDSFYMENFLYPYHTNIINNAWEYNVVAEKRGLYAPDVFFIAGAHYDCFASYDSTYFNNSPGADDNASGVAAILEIARLYQKHNLTPTKTLRLELYGSEETGLSGSNDAMYKLNSRGEHIAAMMCLDMIGYSSDTNTIPTVKLIEYDNSVEFTNFCEQTTNNYTNLLPIRTTEYNQSSDSYCYYIGGITSIFLFEGEMCPFYHTSNDIMDKINFNYLKQTSQLAFDIAYLCSNTNSYYPVSIPQIKAQDYQLTILQNPVKDKIKFTYNNSNSEKGRLVLINNLGLQIINSPLSNYKISLENYEINTQNLNPGVYILRIESSTKATSKKLVVIK